MKTAEVRDKIKEIIKSNKWTYISENQKIDAILESYAKQHAIEFAHYIDVELSDYAKSLKPIREHYTEFLNNKQ